jgi:hypothetical protein
LRDSASLASRIRFPTGTAEAPRKREWQGSSEIEDEDRLDRGFVSEKGRDDEQRQKHKGRGEDTEEQSGSEQFANSVRMARYLAEKQERLPPLDQDEAESRHGGDEKVQAELAWTKCPGENGAENNRDCRHPDLTYSQVEYVSGDSEPRTFRGRRQFDLVSAVRAAAVKAHPRFLIW